MMGNPIKLPDVHQSYYVARKVLRDPLATREQITAACDVLQWSNCFPDISAVRDARVAMLATKDSEHGANFNRRQSQEEDSPPLLVVFVLLSACWTLAAAIGITVQAWWL